MKCYLPRRAGAAAGRWLLAGAALLPWSVHADCQFLSLGDISFGTYDVFSKLPNRAGVGNLRIKCQGIGHAAVVKLSTGQSNNYVTRVMHSSNDALIYNLYTSAARSVVWGDGSGSSSVMAAPKNQNTSLTIFGNIPEGQDPAAGSYVDTILISVDF
jgi:spore coat protein U-like protein